MQVGIITPEQAVAVIKEQRETIKALQSRLSEAEAKLELAKEALSFASSVLSEEKVKAEAECHSVYFAFLKARETLAKLEGK